MAEQNIDDVKDEAYMRGQRAVWERLLNECIRHLWGEGKDLSAAKLLAEREAIIGKLRGLCEDFGDNDWDDGDSLDDVIERNLGNYLHENAEGDEG